MNELASTVFELLKKKQLSRDAAKLLLEQIQNLPQPSVTVEQDKRIAIIGLATELPGARNFDDFWKVLMENEDHVSALPGERQLLCNDFVQAHK